MKIVIMGYRGSGKSTLARNLGEALGLPVLHLDAVHWTPGWVGRPTAESAAIVADFLDSHDSWIIDGDYGKLHRDRRLREADRILLLRLPPLRCLYRVLKRKHRYKNETRPDMGEGCPEKVDLAFAKWVLWEGRDKKRAAFFDSLPEKYPGKVTNLRSQKQIDAWLEAQR